MEKNNVINIAFDEATLQEGIEAERKNNARTEIKVSVDDEAIRRKYGDKYSEQPDEKGMKFIRTYVKTLERYYNMGVRGEAFETEIIPVIVEPCKKNA